MLSLFLFEPRRRRGHEGERERLCSQEHERVVVFTRYRKQKKRKESASRLRERIKKKKSLCFSFSFSTLSFFFSPSTTICFVVVVEQKKKTGIFSSCFRSLSLFLCLLMLRLALYQERKSAWRPGEVFRATLEVQFLERKKIVGIVFFLSMPHIDHRVLFFFLRFRLFSFSFSFFLLALAVHGEKRALKGEDSDGKNRCQEY